MASNFKNTKDAAAHVRATLKTMGIKAKCKVDNRDAFRVYQSVYGVSFTDDQQRAVRSLGVSLGFTWVRGLPIDIERCTEPAEFIFYI